MDIEYILDVMESGQNVDHSDIKELIAGFNAAYQERDAAILKLNTLQPKLADCESALANAEQERDQYKNRVAYLESAWNSKILERKDAIIAGQEREKDRLKSEIESLRAQLKAAQEQEHVGVVEKYPNVQMWVKFNESVDYGESLINGTKLYAKPVIYTKESINMPLNPTKDILVEMHRAINPRHSVIGQMHHVYRAALSAHQGFDIFDRDAPVPAQQSPSSPDKTEYVPISADMKSVFIDGFGLLPIQYPGQSPEVAVPVVQEFSVEEYICIRDAIDRLISAVGKNVDGDQSECSLCAEFIDDIIANVIEPLKIEWFEDDEECGYMHSGAGLEKMARTSPSITEQDARNIVEKIALNVPEDTGDNPMAFANSWALFVIEEAKELLDKINGGKSE